MFFEKSLGFCLPRWIGGGINRWNQFLEINIMFEVFGLKLRFKIDKFESALYGYEGWEILWNCFDMDVFKNSIHYPRLISFPETKEMKPFVSVLKQLY